MKIVKIVFAIAVALFAIVAVTVATVWAITEKRMHQTFDVQPAAVEYAMDTTTITRGAYLFVTRGCAECHNADGSGRIVVEDPSLGIIAGSNITAGGKTADYTDVDWVRALRHGIKPDGKPAIFMPSHEFAHFADADIGPLIAYTKSLPASPVATIQQEIGTLPRFLYLAGEFHLIPAELVDHDAKPQPLPATTDAVAYGEYMAKLCIGCHGSNLSGGPIPGAPPEWPPSANLTSAMDDWTEDDFIAAMKTGKRPDGSEISPVMPRSIMAAMNQTDLHAMWAYLSSLDTIPTGER